MNMLDKIKSAALEGYIKNKFGAYISNGDFKAELDTSAKSLKITATLAGEQSQTVVNVEQFEIVSLEGKEKALVVRKISSNKAWLQKLGEDIVVGKELKLPSFVASAL